jgi:transposase
MPRKKRMRREFTAEFRQEAVRLMNDRLDEGVALAQIGRDLDLEPDLLRKWARDQGKWNGDSTVVSASDPSTMTEAERENEIRRLRRDLERVRQERDFLKKATAFFAKESH